MKTNASTLRLGRTARNGFGVLILTVGLFLGLVGNVAAAAKGGGKDKGDPASPQWIDVAIWLDDMNPMDKCDNGLVADHPDLAYTHDLDLVRAQVGSSQNIDLNLGNRPKKAPPRHFLLSEDGLTVMTPEEADVCVPPGVFLTDRRPAVGTVIPDAWLQILGPDFDDLATGFTRHVNARIAFQDENGQVWMLYFGSRPVCSWEFPECMPYAPCGSCMLVERLPNKGDLSRWQFATEPPHLGYLYLPTSGDGDPTQLAGIVELPWSGLVESLDPLPEPSSEDYVIPDEPAGCPLLAP